jgi:hypothetical protein
LAKSLADQVDQAQSRVERPAADDGRSLATSKSWPALLNISRWAIGRSRETPSLPQSHETLKPPPTLPQALDALGALSGI